MRRVGLVHRIAHSAVSWKEGDIDKGDQSLGGTPYRLHLHHLTESNILGVIPCLPDRMKLDSCLGMDQLIVSAIENERCNEVEGNNPLENYFCHPSQNGINFLCRQVWLIGLN
jgi:hypothetical protein